ncbi:hypothetical protein [Puia sp.]|jgi:hypothetical protein|uniref:hypothetical protein n=1 Tax=Puia sp. TaxID=2045100 RepID=UPI002F4037C4
MTNKTYIQIEIDQNAAENRPENRLKEFVWRSFISLLTKVIPKANPDFEEEIDKVKYWLIECDQASGIPEREIGLNPGRVVILKMPYKENYGYWTDNNLLLDDSKNHFPVTPITQEYFEENWNQTIAMD